MKAILTASQMREADRNTIEYYGIPSAVLMERASLSVANVITEHADKNSKVLVFVGTGNNGGDGVCVARIIHNIGYEAALLICGDEDKFSDELKKQLEIAGKYNIARVSFEDVDEFDVFVDAIFGIGLSRDVTGHFAECINAFNSARGLKVAIDIPSGINTDNGNVCGIACHVDITVTFNYLKPGHLLYPGKKYSGKTIVCDIGINDNSFLDTIKPGILCFDREDIAVVNNRSADTNKGDFGKVLVIAGHQDMSGAAFLSAKAALRMGAGLVKIYTTSDNGLILGSEFPEALISTYNEYDEEQLIEELNWSTVCVIGPGIGQDDVATCITKYVINNYDKPLVIDADALNIISNNMELLDKHFYNRIITPHPGEMSRLTGMNISNIKEDLIRCATDFTDKYGVTTVLKCASTVTSTPSGNVYINMSGNNGMATGGSGDVLAGMIAGLIANHIDVDTAAALGVYIHGLCGDKVASESNVNYLIATDIISAIGKVLRGY